MKGGVVMKGYTITDSCIGCTLCAKNCPVGAITGSLKEKHTIDEGLCISCGLCSRLCAKGAVLNEKGEVLEKIPKDKWEKPYIDKAACAGCSVCIESCPVGCLSLTEPASHGDIRTAAALIDAGSCIGCGLCAKSCPIGAIAMGLKAPERSYKEVKTMSSKLYCRTFQAVMKLGHYFMGYRMPEYIDGPGSIGKMPEFLKAKKANNVLVVTDNGLVKLGLPNGMLKAMEDAGIKYTVFSDIQPNPTSDDVENGFKVYKENGCKAIVAFGGGAPMDCAKGIGAKVAHPKKSVAKLQGILKVMKKIPLFFAVPTTSGTGSETTVAAVITDSATHHKASIMDPHIIPKYAILDPELTIGLPPFVTATTGMDALCHAVESYTNYTYCTKLEKELAKKAVKLIYDNLLKAYNDGGDLEARQNMQLAAFYAGRSFTRGCVGYVHSVGHTLGGLYGVPHGLAMSVILPHVMRQFGKAAHKRLAELADVCGMTGANDAEKAEAFISWIEQLKEDMNLPKGLDMIKEEDVPQIIKWASKEANPLYPVPVIWKAKDFGKLIDTLTNAAKEG